MLENELANTTQGDLSIFQLFIKIKNLCFEISVLDPNEPVSEARIRQHIVHGQKKEYTLFVTSIQGWDQQPSLEEFKNLLLSQENGWDVCGCKFSSSSHFDENAPTK